MNAIRQLFRCSANNLKVKKKSRCFTMANPIEELRNFMAQSRMDFSNWTPIRVATHLIEAGRRSMCGEPPYEFPGGIFFPYDQLLGQ